MAPLKEEEEKKMMMAPEIPSELLIEILKRLPAKSLARFKCVSKLWSSLISSQGYLFPSTPRLFISSEMEDTGCPILLSFSLTSVRKSRTVFDLDFTKLGGGYGLMMALRGLILYNSCGQACIYNPTTGQTVDLPAIKFNMPTVKNQPPLFAYFLGYNPVLDQYKVACTIVVDSVTYYVEHWVFVLEAGSSWKRIELEFDQPHYPVKKGKGVCINGVIYYMGASPVGHIIISFDVRSDEVHMIQLPIKVSDDLLFYDVEIVEYGGKLTLFQHIHQFDQSGLLNLWVFDDAGGWSRKSLFLQPCHRHFFPVYIGFEVIGTTQNGEVILKPTLKNFPHYVLYYDLHKNDVRRVYIRKISEILGMSQQPLYLALMDTGESIMHLKI